MKAVDPQQASTLRIWLSLGVHARMSICARSVMMKAVAKWLD
jgi:hypothetical protein